MSRLLAGVLAALALLACAAAPALAQQQQPNVVVIMTDDQTAATVPMMPQLNALIGSEGTNFEQAIASFPLCCPSRATNLTGQYAHNHGVLHNSGLFGGFRMLDHTNTLPVWLQAAGYRTMHVGRYLNGYQYSDGIPAGYTDWYGSPHANAFNYTNWKVNENGVLRSYPQPERPGRLPDRPVHAPRRRPDRGRRAVGTALLPVALVRRAAPRRPARPGRSAQPGHALPRSASP